MHLTVLKCLTSPCMCKLPQCKIKKKQSFFNANIKIFKALKYCRDQLKFGFGFGDETDRKCSFGLVSVTTSHFTFGFCHNCMADNRNWSE